MRPTFTARSTFQSTLPRGERLVFARFFSTLYTISIHAPARGATRLVHFSSPSLRISIHAPARGATEKKRFPFISCTFQSTLPRGERPKTCAFFLALFEDFNPRSREGSDIQKSVRDLLFRISIHAPARGATSILSKIHPMFLTISHNASSFSSFPFHSFLPHLLNSSTFCALFQVRISRAFSVYYRFAPKKSTPDL